MKIVLISGSPRKDSKTQIMAKYIFDYAQTKDLEIKYVDLSSDGIDYYRGPNEDYSEITKQHASELTQADVWLIATPIYNSFFSSALKNLFEYINYKKNSRKGCGIRYYGIWKYRFYFGSNPPNSDDVILSCCS